MFWTKGKKYHFTTEDEVLKMDKATYDYIRKLNAEKKALEKELISIKPILEDPRLQPAVSKKCAECHFAVFGTAYYTFDINRVGTRKELLGCRRRGLCNDFKPAEVE